MEIRTCLFLLVSVAVCLFILPLGHVQGVITDKYGNSVADGGTISWVSLPVGNRSFVTHVSYSDDGLRMLFAFARNFINTVQPNDFPFGKFLCDF